MKHTDIIAHPRKETQMADYMDLVVVEDVRSLRRMVCRAPWLSHIEVGARVECEIPNKKVKEENTVMVVGHCYDEKTFRGEVVATMDIRKDDDENLDFILECANQKGLGLPKIISKLEVIKLKYKGEDDAEN